MTTKPNPPDTPERNAPGRPDAHSPFVLDVRELGRDPGQMDAAHRTVRAPERYGLDLIAVPADAELEIDVRLESVMEGVLVSGTVSALAQGQCVRCLRPVEEPVELQLTELFAFPESTTEQTSEYDEVGHVVEGFVDIEQAFIDGLGLSLPLQPLCRAECPGLCAVCGIDLAIAEPGHGHDTMDPRWAGLAAKYEEISGRPAARPADPAGPQSQDRAKSTDHRSEEK